MATLYTESLSNLISAMENGNWVRAKHIRRAIDNSGLAKNVLELDGEYKKRYNAFKKAVEKTDKNEKKIEFGGDTFNRETAEKIINTVEGQGEAESRLTYRQLSESSNALMGKLFADLKGIVEAGHKELSILKAQISLLLTKMDSKDPRRPSLRALLLVVQELDAVTKPSQIKNAKGKADLNMLLTLTGDILNSEYDVSTDAQIAVEAFKGIKGEVSFEFENRTLNQLKGQVAARLGRILKGVITGNPKSFDKVFKNFDVTQLKGSPHVEDIIGQQIRDTLDPAIKTKPKKRVVNPKSASGRTKGARTRKKRAKASGLAAIAVTRRKKEKAKASAVSLTNLLGIINARLTDKVAKNMGSPALENRTGRFAGSARAVDVNITPQGFPSIGFTYRKDPYQVFETTSGTRFSSSQRDPRALIGRSIREIALESGVTKLFTRRV
tara:strand:+ start:165 stop:1484 length:1320 start_codon:yes stop_codon:yes gene_type:complete